MQIFLDSANQKEIEKWLREGIIDGLTTNPSIMFKDGVYDIEKGARSLCAMFGDRPVSVEVTSDDPQEMVEQARAFARWAQNVVVKIPVINEGGESCLGAINTLNREGILVNCTAILSFNQAMLAAKAGATYISIFSGRVADEGNDPSVVIRNVRQWLDDWDYTAKIIVGSIRAVMDIQAAALAGAHIITVPPQFLAKMVDHKYTRDTVRQFNEDAEKALLQIAEVHAKTSAAGK
ncbi:MAG TPA: transaldolase family protein [Candidatus Acidoferrales bacterium]|nr:transaldolase family protein [Candidatus Acidoferrales bacterium]